MSSESRIAFLISNVKKIRSRLCAQSTVGSREDGVFVVVVSVEIQPGFDARFFPGGVVAALVLVEKQRVHGASVQRAGENDGTVLERSDDVLSARRRLGRRVNARVVRSRHGA